MIDHQKGEARLKNALSVVKEGVKGNVSVGGARDASLRAHEVAREYSNPTSITVARSIGHAVATAHMSDYSIGTVIYALKAVCSARKPTDLERKW